MSGRRSGDRNRRGVGEWAGDPSADAVLDPWCEVPLVYGWSVLFGFALRHPSTGGLGWLTSTRIVELNKKAGRATTQSGGRYSLGRRIEPEDVPDEGEEAWLTFDILLGAETDELVPRISADPGLEQRWITACKMSRHLKVPPPVRSPRAVDEFLARHYADYRRRLRQLRTN